MLFLKFAVVCKDTVNDFLGKNCPPLAAAISFYALFALFPLTLLLISALGFLLGSSASEARLALDIGNIAPVSGEFVSSTIKGVVGARGITGVAGVLGLLWASNAVFGAIRKGVNAAWGIQEPRPFLQERLIDFSLMVGAGFLMIIFISGTTALGFIEEIMALLSPDNPLSGDFLLNSAATFVPPVLAFLTFLVLYRYLPNTRVTFREVWPGALLAAVAFEVAKSIFVWYAGTYPLYNVVYGSVGAIVALLAWVYISALLLLFGALVTSRYAAHLSAKAEEASVHVWNGLRTLETEELVETEEHASERRA